MERDTKVICPDCDKEVNKADTCSLCGFDITGYEGFTRILNAKAKADKKKADAEQAEKDKNKPAPRKSFFAHLGGGK